MTKEFYHGVIITAFIIATGALIFGFVRDYINVYDRAEASKKQIEQIGEYCKCQCKVPPEQ